MSNFYTSTRDNQLSSTFSNAVLQGISENGGLFVPKNLNAFKIDIHSLMDLDYKELAEVILSIFADDFSKEDIKKCIQEGYRSTFDTEDIVQLSNMDSFTLLELYHGPTSAFKDIALQLLPYFMISAKKIQNNSNNFIILTATSGDTGKAALEGFKNRDGLEVICLYPNQLVSPMQEKQMLSTHGNNTFVYAVDGTFDDCQRMVKEVFIDTTFNHLCSDKHIQLSSANSINIGRLCPQIVYYFYSYIHLLKQNKISDGDKINFVVPTGNFGNILAGYYAKLLGLPIHKLICASNTNNVLTDFIQTGSYCKNREFYKTISPSMDILISSNVERYLFECCEHNSDRVSDLMSDLQTSGNYQLNERELENIQNDFISFCATDIATKETIQQTYKDTNRIVDTHTAVAINCYKQYIDKTDDTTQTVILSTASCYKFAPDVISSITQTNELSEEEAIHLIQKKSNEKLPKNLEEILSIREMDKHCIQQHELRKILLERIKE